MTSIEHHERPARMIRQLMVIGGRSVESSDGRYIDVNPAKRTTIGQVPRATLTTSIRLYEGPPPHSRSGGWWRRAIGAGCSRASRMRWRRSSRLSGARFAQETGNAIRTQARPDV
jgi:hypothetical protein